LQGLLLQVDVAKIVMHEAYDPDAVVDFLDADALAGQRVRDADLLAVHADATASGHQGIAIVQRVGQVGQANIRSW
jgi:hypothetical protein